MMNGWDPSVLTDAFYMKMKKSTHRTAPSNLLKLPRFDQRVGLRDLFATGRFEIEGASMDLRVPVGPAKRRPAPALEPGQPDPFPTRGTPVRPFLLLLRRRYRHRHVLRRYLQFSRWVLNEGMDQRSRDGSYHRRWRRYGGERGWALLLLFKTEIAVAVGA